jgi:hypothetical protein
MVYEKMEQGSGSPKFCWHCGKQLRRAPGKGMGLFYFRTLVDPLGAEHRVHGDCAQSAIGDSVRLKVPSPKISSGTSAA